ncbi:hypothetical protein [Rhodococcoides kyotonense]|uniref:Uncharacterized protein n=1 Tax=Rhodococcoides kyotonense TaxID=398843 RepID=A0A239K431_9NOCA|nr:hypothetical protein [Rhodococcus kyotonensis]SNT12528.1 hypothetical protein SAMN05421642_109225 [Rhodococcus kyotonensis]
MNPSLDVRIQSMIRALTDTVLPQLVPGTAAADQAALVAGHLAVIRDQIDIAVEFDRYELRSYSLLAESLIGSVTGGPKTTSAVSLLTSLTATQREDGPADVCAHVDTLGSAIESLVHAVAVDGSNGAGASVTATVVDHERRRVAANRKLFLGMGWESDSTELPDLTKLSELTPVTASE